MTFVFAQTLSEYFTKMTKALVPTHASLLLKLIFVRSARGLKCCSLYLNPGFPFPFGHFPFRQIALIFGRGMRGEMLQKFVGVCFTFLCTVINALTLIPPHTRGRRSRSHKVTTVTSLNVLMMSSGCCTISPPPRFRAFNF